MNLKEQLKKYSDQLNQLSNLSESELQLLNQYNSPITSTLKKIDKLVQSSRYVGKKVLVKDNCSYKYSGYSFNVLEVYIVYDETNSYGVYDIGSMDLRLDLNNTPFESDKQSTTVINTKYLKFLD